MHKQQLAVQEALHILGNASGRSGLWLEAQEAACSSGEGISLPEYAFSAMIPYHAYVTRSLPDTVLHIPQ